MYLPRTLERHAWDVLIVQRGFPIFKTYSKCKWFTCSKMLCVKTVNYHSTTLHLVIDGHVGSFCERYVELW